MSREPHSRLAGARAKEACFQGPDRWHDLMERANPCPTELARTGLVEAFRWSLTFPTPCTNWAMRWLRQENCLETPNLRNGAIDASDEVAQRSYWLQLPPAHPAVAGIQEDPHLAYYSWMGEVLSYPKLKMEYVQICLAPISTAPWPWWDWVGGNSSPSKSSQPPCTGARLWWPGLL